MYIKYLKVTDIKYFNPYFITRRMLDYFRIANINIKNYI